MSDTARMGACEECGSSDGNATYSDGHTFCYVCKVYKKGNNMQQESRVIPMSNPASGTIKTRGILSDIPERKIKKETAQRYGVEIKKTGNMTTHHIYKYVDDSGNHIASKVREVQNKKFWSEGNLSSSILFGQHLFNKPQKFITVCEGEIDAMSACYSS